MYVLNKSKTKTNALFKPHIKASEKLWWSSHKPLMLMLMLMLMLSLYYLLLWLKAYYD